ncbi:MAG: hypothetical protein HRT68_10775 [Flavobacteriaceae bacterium]|nr:hypothetical protein [Flavobacteriaceae bacterium]
MNPSKATFFQYTPIVGLIIYVLVYSYAITFYPGGSFNYPDATSYSFTHNLVCDAMDAYTPNGALNNARPLAVSAHIILSITMICFFIIVPGIFTKRNTNTSLIKYCGVLSITAFIFLYTSYHDTMVIITAIFGTMAMIPFFLELRSLKNKKYTLIAYIGFTSSFIVFLSFVSDVGRYYLPFVQKISFIIDAVWIVWSCFIVKKFFGSIV